MWASVLEPADGPFMQIDTDHAAIGRAFAVDLGIVADAGAALDELIARAARPARARTAARPAPRSSRASSRRRPRRPIPAPSTPAPCTRRAIIEALNAALPSRRPRLRRRRQLRRLVQRLPRRSTRRARSTRRSRWARWASPWRGVVGGKLAAPDAACVAVVGDGAFLMQGNEISTAAHQSAGAIWIVLDDGDLTMVSQGQEEFFGTLDWTDYYSLGTNDLVGYATALGAEAVEVTDADALPARAGRPRSPAAADRDAAGDRREGRSGRGTAVLPAADHLTHDALVKAGAH